MNALRIRRRAMRHFLRLSAFAWYTFHVEAIRVSTSECLALHPSSLWARVEEATSLHMFKACAMVHVKELMPLTGYVRGGCSPLGMKKAYPTFVHEDCILWDYIYVSAGQRGLQLKLNPQDLLKAANAQAVALCK